MSVVVDEARAFGGLPVLGQPVSVPSFGAREDVFVALLDALFEAGAKAVAWQPRLQWSVFLADEEVSGLRSWDIDATDGLDLEDVKRQFGESSALADATAALQAAISGGMFDAVLASGFGTDSRVIATPHGFEVEPMEAETL